MTKVIGAEYDRNALELARKIFEGTAKTEVDSSNERTCYFCRRKNSRDSKYNFY